MKKLKEIGWIIAIIPLMIVRLFIGEDTDEFCVRCDDNPIDDEFHEMCNSCIKDLEKWQAKRKAK